MEYINKFSALHDGYDSTGMVWPAERCGSTVCRGRRITVGFSVSDETWVAVAEGRATCLCLTCFDEAAQRKNIKYEVLEVFPITWVDANS
jgi:hypothetical protein